MTGDRQHVIAPTPASVREARENVQAALGLGITAAQDWCAAAVHTKRRPWQQWEAGDRAMHPAFWELFGIKVSRIKLRIHQTTGSTN